MNGDQSRAANDQPGAPPHDPLRELLTGALQHQQKNELGQAEQLYRRALTLKPDFAEVHNNLGVVLLAQGKRAEATESFMQALVLRPELLDQFANIVEAFKSLNPAFAEAASKAMAAWPRLPDLHELFGAAGLTSIAADPMLLHLISSTSAKTVEMERLLTAVRAALLLTPEKAGADILGFASALAQQCFINEYVFSVTPAETERLAALKQGDPSKRSPLTLLIIAMYEPLGSLPDAIALFKGDWPPAVKTVVTQQIAEPAEERQLRASIPALTRIDDATSQKVRQQYEENPYPRWVRAAAPPAQPTAIEDYLRAQFPGVPQFATARETIDVLVAGCGTGRNAIEIAQKYRGARVLAIDLSVASLAAAKRKTPQPLADKIQYAQADILNAASLNRTFDLISASGVLHHFADPLTGWRALLNVLKPGGVMHLGLYSDLARRDVVAARKFIAEKDYGASAAEIRRCRQDLMGTAHRVLAKFGDFFSTSECRDLLFHVQESRFTIPAIKAFLAEQNLRFLGFEFDPATMRQVQAMFAQAGKSLVDLDAWHDLETNNPDAFATMYQFWVQKL
jgi:SAM-dependent methyltransferase